MLLDLGMLRSLLGVKVINHLTGLLQAAAAKGMAAEAQTRLRAFWQGGRLQQLAQALILRFLPLTVRPSCAAIPLQACSPHSCSHRVRLAGCVNRQPGSSGCGHVRLAGSKQHPEAWGRPRSAHLQAFKELCKHARSPRTSGRQLWLVVASVGTAGVTLLYAGLCLPCRHMTCRNGRRTLRASIMRQRLAAGRSTRTHAQSASSCYLSRRGLWLALRTPERSPCSTVAVTVLLCTFGAPSH